MNKTRCLIAWQATWLLAFCSVMAVKPAAQAPAASVPVAPVVPVPPAPPVLKLPPVVAPPQTDPELIGVQVPIPKELRVYNKSGSQCVWCTLQMLSTIHNVRAGMDLTLTLKHATGPREVHSVLTQRGVKFKQVNGRDENFIQEYVTNKKLGVGIGVNNGSHMILLCHYDKQKGEVKVIDNSDRQLRVQTWDMQKFRNRFSGWVIAVLPDQSPDATGSFPVGQEVEWREWWNSKR